MKLYELTDAYQRLLDLAAEGEDFGAALDELRGSIQEKAEALAMVAKTLEAEGDVFVAEGKRLQDKGTARRNDANRLKDYLKTGLEAAGIEKVKGNIYTIALQNNPPSVVVPDWKGVPIGYLSGTVNLSWERIRELGFDGTVEAVVNKRRILEEFKATGKAVQGTEIVQGRSLRIR